MYRKLAPWPAIRAVARVAGWVAVSLVLSSCLRFGEGPIDREEWVTQTGRLLEHAVRVEDGAAVMILPPNQATDVYTMAKAISGLGEQADRILDEVGFVADREHFDRGFTEEQQYSQIPFLVYLGGALARADKVAGDLLTEEQVRTLWKVMDEEISDQAPREDVFEVLELLEMSRALGHREGDAERWAAQVSAGLELECRDEDDDTLRELGAVSAAMVVTQPCSEAELAGLWDRAVDTLTEELGGDDARPHDGHCQDLLGLARIQQDQWPGDAARRLVLLDMLDQFEELLEDAQVQDLLLCISNLQSTARLIDTELALPTYVVEYLGAVVRDGAEPGLARLDQTSLATAFRTARLVGGTLEADITGLLDGEQPQRLDLLLATADPGAGWSPEIEQVVNQVAAEATAQDTYAISVLMWALNQGGETHCGSSAVDLARQLVEDIGPGQTITGFPLAVQAQAIRALQVCDLPTAGAEGAVSGRADAVLARLDSDDGGRPELLEAVDAVAAQCALQPESLPDQDDRWEAYADQAGPGGGSGDEELRVISLGRTYSFAVLALTTTDDCREDGLPGP